MNYLLRILYFVTFLLVCNFAVLSQENNSKPESILSNSSTCEDIKLRLDYVAVSLQNSGTNKLNIIFYEGKYYAQFGKNGKNTKNILPKRGEAEARVDEMIDYLVNQRGVDQSLITKINGGFRENFNAEFWVISNNSKVPKLSPTVDSKEIKFRKGKYKRDTRGEGC